MLRLRYRRATPPCAGVLLWTGHERTPLSIGATDCVLTHPLDYVSDMLFNRVLQKGKELALVDVLLGAGASVDFRKDGKGETPLIGMASLGAEDVGFRLLDAGAKPELRGEWGETALHWAALFGEERRARGLIARTDPS
jgi:hypothetical protein